MGYTTSPPASPPGAHRDAGAGGTAIDEGGDRRGGWSPQRLLRLRDRAGLDSSPQGCDPQILEPLPTVQEPHLAPDALKLHLDVSALHQAVEDGQAVRKILQS